MTKKVLQFGLGPKSRGKPWLTCQLLGKSSPQMHSIESLTGSDDPEKISLWPKNDYENRPQLETEQGLKKEDWSVNINTSLRPLNTQRIKSITSNPVLESIIKSAWLGTSLKSNHKIVFCPESSPVTTNTVFSNNLL